MTLMRGWHDADEAVESPVRQLQEAAFLTSIRRAHGDFDIVESEGGFSCQLEPRQCLMLVSASQPS